MSLRYVFLLCLILIIFVGYQVIVYFNQDSSRDALVEEIKVEASEFKSIVTKLEEFRELVSDQGLLSAQDWLDTSFRNDLLKVQGLDSEDEIKLHLRSNGDIELLGKLRTQIDEKHVLRKSRYNKALARLAQLPDPVDPDPTDPDPVDPGQADPDPVDPDPANPDPVDSDPANPDPVDSDPADSDPVDRGPADPNPVNLNSEDPDTVDSSSTDSAPVDPGSVNPAPIDPGSDPNQNSNPVSPFDFNEEIDLSKVDSLTRRRIENWMEAARYKMGEDGRLIEVQRQELDEMRRLIESLDYFWVYAEIIDRPGSERRQTRHTLNQEGLPAPVIRRFMRTSDKRVVFQIAYNQKLYQNETPEFKMRIERVERKSNGRVRNLREILTTENIDFDDFHIAREARFEISESLPKLCTVGDKNRQFNCENQELRLYITKKGNNKNMLRTEYYTFFLRSR